ncbi:YdcF family protein [Actinomyces ruminicola]|uniref:DUF218 domain-containing protein n=1 Tax=Actinomyces ruminicola TaxID=332524 RepID=A0A1G9VW45_9ACTO|nr:YdcF family protein [Actinomyces ruminicola]SDM76504.1 DUF218 domain-containing protein [Actinomyces ruminicola]
MASASPIGRAPLVLGAVVVAVLAAGEATHWIASHCLLGPSAVSASAPGGEAVVVLGHADPGPTAGAENRRRVRAGLRSRSTPESQLVLSGGAVAGPVPEAELMARYATEDRSYTGPLALETTSRSTWENIVAVIPLLEDSARIVIVSDCVHALKARMFLWRQRPDLAARLARGREYRPGEGLLRKPASALAGIIDLGLSAWVPGWARNSATGLAGVRRLLARGQAKCSRKPPRRSRPSVISADEAA